MPLTATILSKVYLYGSSRVNLTLNYDKFTFRNAITHVNAFKQSLRWYNCVMITNIPEQLVNRYNVTQSFWYYAMVCYFSVRSIPSNRCKMVHLILQSFTLIDFKEFYILLTQTKTKEQWIYHFSIEPWIHNLYGFVVPLYSWRGFSDTIKITFGKDYWCLWSELYG